MQSWEALELHRVVPNKAEGRKLHNKGTGVVELLCLELIDKVGMCEKLCRRQGDAPEAGEAALLCNNLCTSASIPRAPKISG